MERRRKQKAKAEAAGALLCLSSGQPVTQKMYPRVLHAARLKQVVHAAQAVGQKEGWPAGGLAPRRASPSKQVRAARGSAVLLRLGLGIEHAHALRARVGALCLEEPWEWLQTSHPHCPQSLPCG